jgi:hypothetical protein
MINAVKLVFLVRASGDSQRLALAAGPFEAIIGEPQL